MAEATPMMQQYLQIKERHLDCILFYRLGDFYEMFNEDAKVASKELNLVLTTRDRSKDKDDEERVPMCGVPFHSYEAYAARLVAKGYKVAICEQMEDPALAKGIVDREVIRVITPGTVMASSMLDEAKSNYICSVFSDTEGTGICFADISTGEMSATFAKAGDFQHIANEIGRMAPTECILSAGAMENDDLKSFLKERIGCVIQPEPERFDFMQCAMHIAEQFGNDAVEKYGTEDYPGVTLAVGALLSYIKDTQKTDISYISSFDFYSEGRYMEMDVQTVRNLELLSVMYSQDKRGSLLWVLDKTKTPMGSRLIRSWISKPTLSPAVIKRRLDAVRELREDAVSRSETVEALKKVRDIERAVNKMVYGSANCRDMLALSSSIENLPEIVSRLSGMNAQMLREIAGMDILSDVKELIDQVVGDDPPFSIREGGMIRAGFNSEVDRLRDLLRNSSETLASIEAREKERTGKKLKVGYNKVFGYYIEIPRSSSTDVPDDYIRKQTLVNAERFITNELKELESELLTAKDRVVDLEYRLFTQLREKIAGEVIRVQETAALIAQADVLCSFAAAAADNNYCMPEIDLSGVISIKDGRHPVVEQMQKNMLFVPNDTELDGENMRAAIITGPNMAGKSTYMRQTALIVLMAQIGSFVPAKSARIGIVDRVFTRIGASDDLSAGKSTFMVEMTEVADILRQATSRSLLILDEIGRGTSTYDGMSIARAVLEYCADKQKLGAKTLFATHYHELTALEGQLQGVKNYNISAKKRGRDIIFLRKIVPGGADESYGIEVAGLAGLPETVIKRAKVILKEIEQGKLSAPKDVSAPETDQISLDFMRAEDILAELENVSVETMTPLEAMNFLYNLKKRAEQ